MNALCDPLPTEQLKRKNQAEIGANWTVEKQEKSFRPFGHRSVELGFDVCFQQNVYPRVVAG